MHAPQTAHRASGARYARLSSLALSFFLLSGPFLAPCQAAVPVHGQAPSLVINLKDALDRARKYGLQLDPAALAVAQAKEDRVQAKAATLPSVNVLNQFIYTEGNGTPSGKAKQATQTSGRVPAGYAL